MESQTQHSPIELSSSSCNSLSIMEPQSQYSTIELSNSSNFIEQPSIISSPLIFGQGIFSLFLIFVIF